MRYYVHRVETLTQGENRIINGYDSYDEALEKFHEYMRDDIKNAACHCANVMITNPNGAILKNEYWEEPKAEPES